MRCLAKPEARLIPTGLWQMQGSTQESIESQKNDLAEFEIVFFPMLKADITLCTDGWSHQFRIHVGEIWKHE